MAVPDHPPLFLKPNTSLASPYPTETTPVPAHVVKDEAADYESEMAIILSKAAKNVTEAEAEDYVLGYTAANDISSRAAQFAQSQWCYGKGFDGSCPIGPCVVTKHTVASVGDLEIVGKLNGEVKQKSKLE